MTASAEQRLPNRKLFWAYAAPYLAYAGIAGLPKEWLGTEANYALRIAAVGALLLLCRRRYVSLLGPKNPLGSILSGALAGLLGCILWILLLTPFAGGEAAQPWSGTAFWLRAAAAVLLVPFFEEMAMRGYVFRLAHQWDAARKTGAEDPLGAALEATVADVPPGGWSAAAVAVSTLVFTAGHQVREWPAAIVFGLLMALLWMRRKDLLSCVAAHAATNAALALYVKVSGNYGLW